MNETALFAISCGLYVVGAPCATGGYSGCIVDAFVQSTAVPVTAILCSQKKGYTCECIRASGRFSVSALREEVDPLTIALFGFQSTRTVQKWPLVSHVVQRELPVLADAAAWYVCEVKQTLDLGSHLLFHAQVMEAEFGTGTPMTYTYYRDHLRQATVAAFAQYKAQQGGIQQ